MDKDNCESALNKGGASPVFVRPITLLRDKWNNDATAYRLALAASEPDSFLRFIQERHEIANTVRERETKGESISGDDAKMLATRIKELHLSRAFDGREDHRAFLIGQCLKLKEGEPVGDVYAAFASLEAANPPPAFSKWRGRWCPIKLAVPAELNATFGVQSSAWLNHRSEDFARDYQRKGFPSGSPASRLFDGGSFFFSLDPGSHSSQPEPGAIPVVPAPNEDSIAQYIELAASSADHWDALVEVAVMLREHRQPFGDALADWLVEVARRNAPPRPKGSTKVQWPKNRLRNHAIVEAVRALERCGMKAATDREPGPACAVCAEVFALAASTVRDIWNSRGTENSTE